jgi:DNA-binding MarR family transcriptional regulator
MGESDEIAADGQPKHEEPDREEQRSLLVNNHLRLLLCLQADRDASVPEIAFAVGVTERTAYRLLKELERVGYLRRRRGRPRNVYELDLDFELSDSENGSTLEDLLKILSR